ncbi:MAG: diadenylate cyclase [Bacillota bacterium]
MALSTVEFILINIYLLAVFALLIKSRTNVHAYRLFKAIIIALAIILMRELSMSDYAFEHWSHAVLLLAPVLWIVVFFIQGEVIALLKYFGVRMGLYPSNMIEDEVKYEIMDSVDYLSRHRIGAIITFERSNSLEEYINSAFLLKAPLSSELLSSIFYPNTPLHDGAVIVKENTIMCAGAYFPPSDNPKIPKYLGSRHRAAIGVSEISDAFTIIVSEQTGQISVTVDGYLDQDISAESLELYLQKYLQS